METRVWIEGLKTKPSYLNVYHREILIETRDDNYNNKLIFIAYVFLFFYGIINSIACKFIKIKINLKLIDIFILKTIFKEQYYIFYL